MFVFRHVNWITRLDAHLFFTLGFSVNEFQIQRLLRTKQVKSNG